jgi:Na+/melibiose symporter-like transporter
MAAMTDPGSNEVLASDLVTADSLGSNPLLGPSATGGSPGADDSRPAAATAAPRSLWRHRDFMALRIGQSVSEVGSSVTTVALPLTAVVLLHASTLQVGLLSAAGTASFLLVALPAGLVVDRVAKRWLMLSCDLARMVIIGSVAVAAAFHVLTMGQVYAVALLSGLATVFFDVAYQSYVPSLVKRDQLHEANGKLGASQAFAGVVGPSLGGALFGLIKAGAMTVDAISYGVSTVSLLLIRAREPVRVPGGKKPGQGSMRQEVFAGLSFVLSHRVLRKIAACTGTANLFGAMSGALEILFLVRVVHVRPAEVGVLFGIGSLGGIGGGLLSGRLSRWIGSARIIWFSMLVFGAVPIVMPLTAPGPRLVLFPIAAAGLSFTALVYNIAQLSYRQLITPPELLGRMNAAIRWIVWGTLPLGGVIGGVLGSASVLGIRPTLWIGVLGSWAAGFWVLFSPLRTMRDIPAHDQADDKAQAQRGMTGDHGHRQPGRRGPLNRRVVLDQPDRQQEQAAEDRYDPGKQR